jgi:hypothetical protein
VKKHIVIATIVTFCFIGIVSTFLITTTQSQTKVSQQIRSTNDDIPSVFYENSENKSLSAERETKNAKYDNWKWVQPKISNEETKAGLINHWQLGISALPFDKCDAVIIGVVNSHQAFLSNDKTGIYSEFSVKIETVIKDNQLNTVEKNQSVTIQRAGGKVIYSSDKAMSYMISGQDMPRLNGKYAFFLKYDLNTKCYFILTAYEFLDGKILSLDGKGRSPLAGFNFSKYDSYDEKKFVDELYNAAYLQTTSSEEKTAP